MIPQENYPAVHSDSLGLLASPSGPSDADSLTRTLGVRSTPVRPSVCVPLGLTPASPSESNLETGSECDTAPAGTEHFSIWLREPGTKAPRFVTAWVEEAWPEFDPARHYDFRQPSRLTALLAPAMVNP